MQDQVGSATDLRVPNLLIVGVAKAGTTSLFHYLTQHPDVFGPDVKELRYFSPLQYGEPLAPLDSYVQHFAGWQDEKYALEATPGYFYGGRPLAQGIAEASPSVKTMVVLRSPGDRCWSFFRFVKARLRIPKEMTFSEYLDQCEAMHESGADLDRENGDYSGLGKGCYADWLDIWTQQFGDRFRILFFEDIAADPWTAVTSICNWLDIATDVVAGFQFAVDNKTEQYRNKHLQRAAVTLSRRGQGMLGAHPGAKRLLRRGYYAMNRGASEASMSDAERARLADFYRPHNARLAAQLAALDMELPAAWSKTV